MGISSFSTVALSGTAVQSSALGIPSFSPAVIASRDPNIQPWSICYTLEQGSHPSSQCHQPILGQLDHLTIPTAYTAVLGLLTDRLFIVSGPFGVSPKTSMWKWDTGCVTTYTAAGETAREWLFLTKPVGPVPPPSSSFDDSKKNKANPNNV